VKKIPPFYEVRKTELTVKHNKYEVTFPSHMHQYIEILYIFSGAQHIKIDNDDYKLSTGEMAIIFPDIVHSYYSAEEKTVDELLIMCAPKLLSSLFPNLSDYRPENPIITPDKINEETLFSLTHIKPDDNFEIKLSWTIIILSNAISLLRLNSRHNIQIKDLAFNITRYIENNFTEEITRESLAKKFNVSPNYISRVFSTKIKTNLRSYLGLVRSEYASMLIRTTNRTLTDISAEAGFDSIRTFSRVFKGIYGISPKVFRNNITKFTNR